MANARCTAVKTDGSVYYNSSTYNKAFSGSVITVTGGNNTNKDLVLKTNVACKIMGGYYKNGTTYTSLSGDYNANVTLFNDTSFLPQISIIAIKK